MIDYCNRRWGIGVLKGKKVNRVYVENTINKRLSIERFLENECSY